MLLTLNEIKTYLRVDHDEEDALLQQMNNAAEQLCAHVVRVTQEELQAMADDNIRTAVLYAVAYLYEHREEADHRKLTLTLRALLFGVRKEGF